MFAFGENWADYADGIGEVHIVESVRCLRNLVGDLTGKSFLDVGCGSGIHSLAALHLGADSVYAVDIDSNSVDTTTKVLKKFSPTNTCRCETRSVFDLDRGAYDVVYSWGVLHHTGHMKRAIRCAAQMVAPHGMFVFALYRKTYLCPLWKAEKWWYSRANSGAQAKARRLYVKWFRFISSLCGQSPDAYMDEYHQSRGMDFSHDVHDWLGGYPYESATPYQIDRLMRSLGFDLEKLNPISQKPGKVHGLLGSGCDEYVYRRK